jgi:putative addiction module component (TIGR02574 family)
MVSILEVEKLALTLPESDRAILASHLLHSLPPALEDADEGVAEAMRRDADLDANPDLGLTLDQLDQRIRDRR